MALKTYVLLDELKPTAPIYIRVADGQRQKLDSIPVYGIPLRTSFTDKDGNYKVHRYKANATSVDQAVQISEQKIEANTRWTTQERRDREFRNNILFTNKVGLQNYLESLPYMEGVGGTIDGEKTPIYRLLDKEKEAKSSNSLFKLRLKVGNMIADLNLVQAQELLIRLNGSHFQTPETIEDCQNLLVDYMNEVEEVEDLENMLRNEVSADEKATILVGNAINKGILNFDVSSGNVTKKKGSKEVVVRTISAQDNHEMQRLFIEFLTTDSGKALYSDIEKSLSKD